jgi:hypothetical protein
MNVTRSRAGVSPAPENLTISDEERDFLFIPG